MRNRVHRHTEILPDSDLRIVIPNAPLRVKDHVRLVSTALYEHLSPLVVDWEVCDELLGESLHLSKLLIAGHQTRKFDFSK
jgi:hypothetical protein